MPKETTGRITYLGISGASVVRLTEAGSESPPNPEEQWAAIFTAFRMQNENKKFHFIPNSYTVKKILASH